MADNDTTYLPSTDLTAVPVASDDIAGVRHQLVKVEWGPADSATQVADVDGQRLPVGGNTIGLPSETAPASDTASSGLNGRLQRIAQRLTTLIGVNGDPTDAIVAAGAAGTLSAKLRRVTQGLEDLKTLIALAASTNVIGKVLKTETTATATISIGTSTTVSNTVDVRGYDIVGIVIPSTFDGSVISFQVSNDNVTFQPLYDFSDSLVTMTVTPSRSYPVYAELIGWSYIKIICSTAQATTDTVFTLQLRS